MKPKLYIKPFQYRLYVSNWLATNHTRAMIKSRSFFWNNSTHNKALILALKSRPILVRKHFKINKKYTHIISHKNWLSKTHGLYSWRFRP